ncbi:hypothetical protein DFJ74DRAFT_516588 [Hyaloraphidium curvatum]|nr:hypothetical protein DFJ74DRAFT_516588 [Hyaloraphidium curvatum]
MPSADGSGVPADGADPFDGLDTIPLSVVDWSLRTSDPEGVAQTICAACKRDGFFILTNHGVPGVERGFGIAKELFALPREEKDKFSMGTSGNYFGYKSQGAQVVNARGDKDGNEYYNTPKASSKLQREHPAPIASNMPHIASLTRDSHALVLELLRILSEGCGLDPEYFGRWHRWSEPSGDMLRMIRYPPRPDTEDERTDGVRMVGHTDFGSITLLYSQEVGGLQVKDPHDGAWKWVRPVPGSIIVNVGDALQFWTSGELRSSMHRVVRPPGKQKDETRYSLVYFSRPEDSVLLKPIRAGDSYSGEVYTAAGSSDHPRHRSHRPANFCRTDETGLPCASKPRSWPTSRARTSGPPEPTARPCTRNSPSVRSTANTHSRDSKATAYISPRSRRGALTSPSRTPPGSTPNSSPSSPRSAFSASRASPAGPESAPPSATRTAAAAAPGPCWSAAP